MPKADRMHPDELVLSSEVAALLGVDVATVNRWARSGRLKPVMKVPGGTGPNLFRRSDVDALLVDQTKSAS